MKTAQEAAKELGISYPRIKQLLLGGRIKGAKKKHGRWEVPNTIVVKPSNNPRPGKITPV